MEIVVMNHVTLDGVMQAPGRPDEDARGGFAHGGWAAGDGEPDPAITAAMGERMARSDGLLLGRRTYDDLLAVWNERGGPFKDALNRAPKFVPSATLGDVAPWPNTTVLRGDVVHEVRDLQARAGRELHIMGSGQLVAALQTQNLIDEYVLFIHPIVLGAGRRLFPADGRQARFDLVDATPAASGVVVATYRAKANRGTHNGDHR